MWEDKLFAWADSEIGATVDKVRGNIPRSLAVMEFAAETFLDEYAIASDKVLTEAGVCGVPLNDYFDENLDPFNRDGSIWFGCRDLIADAALFIEGSEKKKIPAIGFGNPDDVWYLSLLRFSIGLFSVRHILKVVMALPNPGAEALRHRIVGWSESADFHDGRHAAYWARQSPGLVQKRIRKQLDRLRWAQKIGPTSGPEYKPGPVPPATPEGYPTFPEALRAIAQKKRALPLKGSTPQETQAINEKHAALHAEVVAYRNRRRRKDPRHVPWRVRFSRWTHSIETRNRTDE